MQGTNVDCVLYVPCLLASSPVVYKDEEFVLQDSKSRSGSVPDENCLREN